MQQSIGIIIFTFLHGVHMPMPMHTISSESIGSCSPKTLTSAPHLELARLSSPQVQFEEVSPLISPFYSYRGTHTAYFFPNGTMANAWVEITCTAAYPIEIDIDSPMAVRVAELSYSRLTDFKSPCPYKYEVSFKVALAYSVTGAYVCREIGPTIEVIASKLYLFVNDGDQPTLLNAKLNIRSLEVDGIPDDEGLIRIPCISTDPRKEPYLFKVLLQQLHRAIKGEDYVHYVPGQGFLISARNNVPVSYSCTLGNFSLQFRLRDLTTQNIGKTSPVHFRVSPSRRGDIIYDPDKQVTMDLVCEANRPVVLQRTLVDSKLRFVTNQSENEGTFYKYKTMLTMIGQIRRNFTVTCVKVETGGILYTWRYSLLQTSSSFGSPVSLEPGNTHTYEAGRHHFRCVASENKTPFIALIECGNHLNCKTAQKFSYLVNTLPEFYPFNVSIGYACYKQQSPMGCAIIPLEIGTRDGLVMCREETSDRNDRNHNVGVIYYYQNYYSGLGGRVVTELKYDTANDALQFLPNNTQMYLGQNATFVCEARTFLFAKGLLFYIHFKNDSKLPAREYEPDFSKLTINETLEDGLIRSRITLPIKSLDIQKLGCSAPSWNTPKWQSIFVNLDVIEGEFVQLLSSSQDETKVNFTVGQDSATEPGDKGVNDIGFPTWAAIIIPSLAVVCVLGLGLLYMWYRLTRLRRAVVGFLTDEEVKKFFEGKTAAVGADNESVNRDRQLLNIDSLPYNSEHEVTSDELEVDFDIELGSGNYGVVYLGRLRHIPVAIKTVRPNVPVEYFHALMPELKILAHIGKHDHIANLLGANSSNVRNRVLYVAVELCKTSLLQHLRERERGLDYVQPRGNLLEQESSFSEYQNQHVDELTDLIRWAAEIASGMEFLEGKRVVHGDLAARNVLLSVDMRIKICDFGLARQLIDYAYIKSRKCDLPWKWLAPESLSHMHFSTKSDVWAYGITLWEVFSLGGVPYPGTRLWTLGFVIKLAEGERLPRPTYATHDIYAKMLECWNLNREARPGFAELKQFFENRFICRTINV